LLSLVGGDDADTRGDKHSLTVNWALKQPGGAPAACPAGFENLALWAVSGDDDGEVLDIMPCQPSGSRTLELYTSGERRFMMDDDPDTTYVESFTPDYRVTLYATDPTGEIERAVSLASWLTLDSDQTLNMELYPDGGVLLFSWELFSGFTDGFIYSCEAGSIDEVELRYRPFTVEGDPPAPLTGTTRWPCTETHDDHYYLNSYAVGQGFTPALPPNDYVAEMVGFRSGVAVASDTSVSFKIETGNHLTETTADMTVEDR